MKYNYIELRKQWLIKHEDTLLPPMFDSIESIKGAIGQVIHGLKPLNIMVLPADNPYCGIVGFLLYCMIENKEHILGYWGVAVENVGNFDRVDELRQWIDTATFADHGAFI